MQTITEKARVLHPKPGCLVICLPRIHQVGAAMGGALGVAASPFLGGKPQEHSESPPPSPNYRYAILGLISRKCGVSLSRDRMQSSRVHGSFRWQGNRGFIVFISGQNTNSRTARISQCFSHASIDSDKVFSLIEAKSDEAPSPKHSSTLSLESYKYPPKSQTYVSPKDLKSETLNPIPSAELGRHPKVRRVEKA